MQYLYDIQAAKQCMEVCYAVSYNIIFWPRRLQTAVFVYIPLLDHVLYACHIRKIIPNLLIDDDRSYS